MTHSPSERLGRRTRLAAAAVALTLASPANLAHAQLTVFDPTNYSQNVLTAARELQQINNQIRSLENQASMLINQGRNLVSLPYSVVVQLQATFQRTQQLLMQAQHIAYNLTAIDQAFAQAYPPSYASATSAQMANDAHQRWSNALAGFQDAMRVQAGVVENLSTTRTQLTTLVAASQSAPGALSALQAGGQIQALQTQQLADLTAVMAAIARAESLDGARAVEGQVQAQQQLTDFLDYGAGYQPGSAQMFH